MTLLAAAALLLTAAPVSATASACSAVSGNLLTNCGFETFSTTGWAVGGDTNSAAVSSESAHTGSYGFEAGSAWPAAGTTLSQSVSTTAGHAYVLAYWIDAARPTTSEHASGFDSAVYEGSTYVTGFGMTNPGSGWQSYTLSWTAASSSATIDVTFIGGTDGIFYFDDVEVIEVPDMTGTTATKAQGKVTVDLASVVTWTSAECRFVGRATSWQACTDGQVFKTSAKSLYVRGSNDGGTTWGPERYVPITR